MINQKSKQNTNIDFEKEFIKRQLIKVAKKAAVKGIPVDIFEALLITLCDEMNFKAIMTEH